MIELLKFHLTGLLRFSGRESRAQFWPWVAIVFAANMAMTFAIMVPKFFEAFSRIGRFAAEHPDQATVTRGPGSYSVQVHGYHPELMPDFMGMIGGVSISAAITVVLLAAAVVRRLHDCNRTGLWGLLPLPFLSYALIMMPRMFGQMNDDTEGFFALFLNNVVYLAALGLLAYLLAQPGKPDPDAL